jgi:hypothetical protein
MFLRNAKGCGCAARASTASRPTTAAQRIDPGAGLAPAGTPAEPPPNQRGPWWFGPVAAIAAGAVAIGFSWSVLSSPRSVATRAAVAA